MDFDLVMINNIPYDKVNLPIVIAKQAKRVTKQHYKPRSKFGNPNNSSWQCSRCKQFGHNAKSYTVPDSNFIGWHSVN